MNPPLVSVIIPAHNAAPFIAETIESVLRQTYKRRELIVVDDGSTDDTLRRLASYHSSLRIIQQKQAGQGGARNAGLTAAFGNYIAFLDHDDLWAPEKLEIQLTIAAQHPDSGLIACDGVMVDGDQVLANTLLGGPLAKQLQNAPGDEVSGHVYREDVLDGNPITTPSQTLIPRHVVDCIGPLTPAHDEPTDWDYYLRIAARYPMTFHRHALVRYRYLASSLSGPLEQRAFVYALMNIRMLRRYLRNCPPEDRPLTAAKLRRVVRGAAYDAYYFGRQHGMGFARHYLVKLLRLCPRDRHVARVLIASWLPDATVHWLAHHSRRNGRGSR